MQISGEFDETWPNSGQNAPNLEGVKQSQVGRRSRKHWGIGDAPIELKYRNDPNNIH
jgi:hypothetical protein